MVNVIIQSEITKYLSEGLIKIPQIPNTMNFFHGGDLDSINDSFIQKKGRFEYGVGLYLINHYETALKYSKGSRKLYMVSVEYGNELENTYLDKNIVLEFINHYIIGSKRKEIINRLSKYEKDNNYPAYILNNIIINENAITTSNTRYLMEFFRDNSIDYSLINNPFGWGETMMVLFNMKKIKKIIKINSGDRLESYDL